MNYLKLILFCVATIILTGCNLGAEDPYSGDESLTPTHVMSNEEVGSNHVLQEAEHIEYNTIMSGSFMTGSDYYNPNGLTVSEYSADELLDVDIYSIDCVAGKRYSAHMSVDSGNDNNFLGYSISVMTDKLGVISRVISLYDYDIDFEVTQDDRCYVMVSALDDQYYEYDLKFSGLEIHPTLKNPY